MTLHMNTDVITTMTQLETLLILEEHKGSLTGIADLVARMERRTMLRQHMQTLGLALEAVKERLANLPELPPFREITWAQALSQFDNLAFLEVDTTGLESSAEIIRVLLLDRQGETLCDRCIRPTHPLSSLIRQITGLTQQDVEQAPPLMEVWPDVGAALTGRYLLSFNLKFDRTKLLENAQRAGVEMPILIGDCLQQHAMAYFHATAYPRLEAVCQQIGHPLPTHPQQTAHDRAMGQRHLLEAMSQGIMTIQPSAEAEAEAEEEDDPLADLEDHPF